MLQHPEALAAHARLALVLPVRFFIEPDEFDDKCRAERLFRCPCGETRPEMFYEDRRTQCKPCKRRSQRAREDARNTNVNSGIPGEVFAAIKAAGGHCNSVDIMRAVTYSSGSIRKALIRMANDGRIVRWRRGYYTLPGVDPRPEHRRTS